MSEQETIIAQGVRVEGDFVSQGPVVIDGEVAGSVKTTQSLRVGDNARIEADVVAQSAIIAGQVFGKIQVQDRLELHERSVVQGDIEASVFSVAAGAQINGTVTMGEVASEEPEADEE